MISPKIPFISQRGKKKVSDSPGLVDLAVWLINSVLNLPVRFCGEFKLLKNCNQSCWSKRVFGQVEMTYGLVHVSYSFPEWQALNLTLFAPWSHCHQHFLTLTGLLYPQLWELALFWPTFNNCLVRPVGRINDWFVSLKSDLSIDCLHEKNDNHK